MKILEKIKEKLKHTNYFNLGTMRYLDNGNVFVYANPKCLIAEPLTPESAKQIRSNPYTRQLKSKEKLLGLYRFPLPIHDKNVREDNIKQFEQKFRTRLANLKESQKLKNINLLTGIDLPAKVWLDFEYVAKPFKNKEKDFKDDEPDTTCKALAQPQKPYQEIKRVSLSNKSYTILILKNARKDKNKALNYYLEEGSNIFYRDIVLQYILLHAELLEAEYFNYDEAPKEVRIPAKELFKLYHHNYKLDVPDGVTLTNISRPDSKRISKNDILSFKFSDEFLQRYKNIVHKSAENVESPESFIKVPVFFLKEAMKDENLTHNGFKFLLWFLCFYRIDNPKIYHNIRTIIAETGMCTVNGYRKPLKVLNRYFEYLHSVNVFPNIPEFVPFTTKDLDKPPMYKVISKDENNQEQIKEVLFQIKKPTIKKELNNNTS